METTGEKIRRYRKMRNMTQALKNWTAIRKKVASGKISEAEYEEWKASL